MKIVLCCGVFDILHPSHVRHLEEARNMGDLLIVALTLDEYVNKPGRPIFTYDDRWRMLKAIRYVDSVVANIDAARSIREIQPQVYVKGSDYVDKGLTMDEVKACEEVNALIRFTQPYPHTTTAIIERIKANG